MITKLSKIRGRVVYTFLMVFVLIATMVGIITYMYHYSEHEASERLRLETTKFKTNIHIQMNSDMETLRSMASLVSERFTDEASFLHICQTFEAFGFCENIGILVPDNRLITKFGAIDVSGKISFEDEARRGEYVSGSVVDLTNEDREVVRSAVPIVSGNGQVIAIMYGTIDTERLAKRYTEQAESIGAYLCILEGKTGKIIIDTKGTTLSNITKLASVAYKDGYTYDMLVKDMTNGKSGYTAFIADDNDEYLYIRYGSLNISDWQIMLALPESVIFASTRATISFLIGTSAIILLIMLIYITFMFASIRRMLKMNSFAADIRKSLLEINQRSESLEDALEHLVKFARARSAFITDSYNEEHHYIRPEVAGDKLTPYEIEHFNKKLILYAARHRKTHGASVHISQIRCDETLRNEMPDFYDFIRIHKIECVKYAVVINNNSNIYVLGVLNPKSDAVSDLLKKIAVCFSMAVYNDKHLKRTERMALTDSLTNIANRMAYNQDIQYMHLGDSNVACIYVDVNELHYYNNKYGHAAGDQMLIFIAQVLGREFRDSYLYRMGGDEFLILSQDISIEEINKRLDRATQEIEEMKYHIAVGVSYGKIKTTLEDMVNEAEKIMYDKKAKYYQDKELSKVTSLSNGNAVTLDTGIRELDACLSVMTLRYLAVYCVSFAKDRCVRILAPSYFKDVNDESNLFSLSMQRYFHEFTKPEYHRSLLSFLDYEALEHSLEDGKTPSISYERIDGEKVKLTVYSIDEESDDIDTVWVFEKNDM